MSKYINPFLDWSFKHIFGRDSVKDIYSKTHGNNGDNAFCRRSQCDICAS